MCGIAGIIGNVDLNVIDAMTKILSHRGPDDLGIKIFETSGAALGHTRLSIIDLTPGGHQPMCDDTKKIWITYNGELYNYRELGKVLMSRGYQFKSNSDTEVILYAYKEWGTYCVNKFNGMFAFGIWDDEKKIFYAARDRMGIKPFYYYYNENYLIFASEIKSLFKSKLVPKEIDYFALFTPARSQIYPYTGFKSIFKLKPGNYLVLNKNKMQILEYWKIKPRETDVEEKIALDELEILLNESVKDQMIADVPVGAFLSGGLDSSIITALMTKNTEKKISTFTIKFSEQDQRFEQMPDDSKYARRVANLFGCQHYELEIKPDVIELLPKIIWHLDEPLSDPATINTYLIAKLARENGIVVLLNGMGGDEIFAGYRNNLACLIADIYKSFVPEIIHNFGYDIIKKIPTVLNNRGVRTIRWLKRFLSFSYLPQDLRFFFSEMQGIQDYNSLFSLENFNEVDILNSHYVQSQKPIFQRDDLSYLTKMCLSNSQYFLPDHNLLYSDKCTMAIGVESRPPLIDHRIVEYIFNLSPKFKINGLEQKYLLKKVAEKYLSKDIVYRPKAPFGSPLRSWIRGPLSEMVGDYLSPASIKNRGIYNLDFVLRKIKKDKDGIEDNAHLIWTLLCNEIWMRTFFK